MKRTRPLLYALCALLILPGCASETDEERKARLIEEDLAEYPLQVICQDDGKDEIRFDRTYYGKEFDETPVRAVCKVTVPAEKADVSDEGLLDQYSKEVPVENASVLINEKIETEEDGTKVMTFVIGIHNDPDAKTMNEVYDACVAEGDTCTKNE